MTRAEISHAVGAINIRYITEAEEYCYHRKHHIRVRRIALIAAILITTICMCAFTYGIFSTMAGDNLILTVTYAGDGIIHAHVDNQSNRDLKLEPVVKLLYYSDKAPVETTDEQPVITGLSIPAGTKQTVRIDLRKSYDLFELEHTYNDLYLLQLTNRGFAPGQKWTCTISFRPQAGEYVPQYVKSADTKRAETVIPSLKAYFENFTPDVFARWGDVPDYLELVEQELAKVKGNIVAPVDPYYYWDLEEFPTLVQSSCFDGYNKLLGRNDMEKVKHISIFVPRLLDGKELNGSQEIPIFYLWIFPVSEIQSPDDYAYIRGNLLTFKEMEAYKVFEDDEYVIYEMHHLVYSDLRNYVEEMLLQNSSIYFNEEVWERIQRFYNTYSDPTQLKNSIKPLDQRYDRIPMEIKHVQELSSKGKAITFEDLKPYSRFWEDIDYAKGHGLSFRIDSDYELFYELEPNGTLKGYYLYHNPSGDKIDIRYEDVSKFVDEHGAPQPRCKCSNTEEGDHGWHLTLDWLQNMEEDVIISYIPHVCSYRIEENESPVCYYPLDDEQFHVEVDWSIAAGEATYRDENIWLIHDASGDRCNVRTDNVAVFIESHK